MVGFFFSLKSHNNIKMENKMLFMAELYNKIIGEKGFWKSSGRKVWIKLFMVAVLLVSMYFLGGSAGRIAVSVKENERFVVVVDAGHGGNDPGKTVGDVYEKDINLSIALKLKAILEKEGIEVVMTREEDKGLYEEGASNKKITDMKNRCNLVNSSNADILVSIHQNSYSSQGVKGAQVFYYEHSKGGERLASIIQRAIKENVDKENGRQQKANDSYYILLNVTPPAVIVECGFLTNPDEKEKLLTEEYQQKMAEAIAMGIIEYKNEN